MKAGVWGLCGLEGPVEWAESTWSEPREQRRGTKATREPPGQGLEAWEFPGLSVKSGSKWPRFGTETLGDPGKKGRSLL